MTRSLAIAVAAMLLALPVTSPTSATAADVKIQTAVLQTADSAAPATTSLLSTNVNSTPVTPVHWRRYYAYRPYYRPYYAYRPYYGPYYRSYYRPYYRSYYGPYWGYYYGGPVYW